jgi:drug/metabolite transporter (DMT)-like permease
MVLGAFEIVLGVVVLVWRDEFGLFFYSVVTVWAFAAALVLLREALRQRARAKARVVN